MHERNMRYNKKLTRLSNYLVKSSHFQPRKPRCIKATIGKQIIECVHLIHKLPYIKDFALFERYCLKINIEEKYINTLWETTQLVEIYEVSRTLMQAQLASLAHIRQNCDLKFFHMKTLLVCLYCCQFNPPSLFRYNPRSRCFSCNRCEIIDSVVEIDMLGRIVKINGVPLFLSPHTNQIVLYNGFGLINQHTINEIKWNLVPHISTLKNACNNLSMSCVLSSNTTHNNKVTLYATRSFIDARKLGCIIPHKLDTTFTKQCCFCRSTMIVEQCNLLDIYNMAYLIVSVCIKHKVPVYVIPLKNMNICTYIDIVLSRKRKK
jgi:hypothetical protein